MNASASVDSKGTYIAPELCKFLVLFAGGGWTLDRATELTTDVSND